MLREGKTAIVITKKTSKGEFEKCIINLFNNLVVCDVNKCSVYFLKLYFNQCGHLIYSGTHSGVLMGFCSSMHHRVLPPPHLTPNNRASWVYTYIAQLYEEGIVLNPPLVFNLDWTEILCSESSLPSPFPLANRKELKLLGI